MLEYKTSFYIDTSKLSEYINEVDSIISLIEIEADKIRDVKNTFSQIDNSLLPELLKNYSDFETEFASFDNKLKSVNYMVRNDIIFIYNNINIDLSNVFVTLKSDIYNSEE